MIENLFQHCQDHFLKEEEILQRQGYPAWEEHRKVHHSLFAEAVRLREKFLQGTLEPAEFYSFLLGKVILGHLMTADAKFFPYLK